MEITGTRSCCGMGEISGVHDYTPEENLRSFIRLRNGGTADYSMYVFSDNQGGGGRRLADTIAENDLGHISGGHWTTNSARTGNQIAAWIWIPNVAAINRFLKGPEKPKATPRRRTTRRIRTRL